MRKLLILICHFISTLYSYSQDLLNPYSNYDTKPRTDLIFHHGFLGSLIFDYNTSDNVGAFNGEYEIILDKYPWGTESLVEIINGVPLFDLDNFALSFKIELVSFPFSIDCAFPSLNDSNGGCVGSIDRVFNVPGDNSIDPTIDKAFWIYPIGDGTSLNLLRNISLLKPFDRQPFRTISDQSHNNALVSIAFGKDMGASLNHTLLPHSVLKHTINIHCGPSISNQIISSFVSVRPTAYGKLEKNRL